MQSFQAVHISTRPLSRQKNPLATTPCRRGNWPVVMLACTGHVTAGKLGTRFATPPAATIRAKVGNCPKSCLRRPGIERRITLSAMKRATRKGEN